MAHPLHHAESSARKFGGIPADYQEIHNWLAVIRTIKLFCSRSMPMLRWLTPPRHRPRSGAGGGEVALFFLGQSLIRPRRSLPNVERCARRLWNWLAQIRE